MYLSLIKKLLTFTIIFVFLFELFALILTKNKLLPFNQVPTYSFQYPKGFGLAWRNEKMPWGAWHKKNFEDYHKYKCFNVAYKSNDIGSRDKINYLDLKNKNTIIFIGDSMVEGIGVDFNKIITSLVKKKLGVQTINLSAAGDFGPIQYYLIYEKFKKSFIHNKVFLFINPYNDFNDNFWEHWKKIDRTRYRPYFKKINDQYEIFYPDTAKKRDHYAVDISLKGLPMTFIKNFTYSANVLRTLKYREYIISKKYENFGNIINNSGYYFNNQDALEGSFFYIEKFLKKNFQNKEITIVLTPLPGDIISFKNGNNYKSLNWFKILKNLGLKYNVKIIDLMDNLDKQNYKYLFHECDEHWNENGHKFVLGEIIKAMQ